MIAVTALLAAGTPNPDSVTPGPVGFFAIAFVAIAVVLLGFDLVRRIRRATYRAEIQEKLAAEQREATPTDPTQPPAPTTPHTPDQPRE